MTTIVVTVKDGAPTLGGLLSDFDALDWPEDRLRIVLVDAFSQDGTWERIQDWKRSTKWEVVAVQKAGGISAGRNEGLRHAVGDFVAVTDADMRVPPHWLRGLHAAMEEGIAVVGGPNEAESKELFSRGVATLPTHGPSRGAVFPFLPNKYHAPFTTDQDVYASVTRNSLFRRAAVEQVGLFDERLVVTEDPELNRRLLDAGWRLRYTPDAPVRHVHRESLGAFFHQQRMYAFWQARVNRKHPSLFRFKHWLPPFALASFLALLALAPWMPWALTILTIAVLATIAYVLAYTFQAALQRNDGALFLIVPSLFLLWQLAWAIGYTQGSLTRGPPG